MQTQTKSLQVSISSADEVVWEGTALSVSSENQEGKFDVLPGHANFITIVTGKPITIQTSPTEEQKNTYKSAVIYALEDTVKIFVDI